MNDCSLSEYARIKAKELTDSFFNKEIEPDGWVNFYEQALTALDAGYRKREQSLEDVEKGIRWERDCRLRINLREAMLRDK